MKQGSQFLFLEKKVSRNLPQMAFFPEEERSHKVIIILSNVQEIRSKGCYKVKI